MMTPIMNPYSPTASAKIKMRSKVLNIFSYCAFAHTPASPIIPIAIPADKQDNPQTNPAPKNL